MMPVRYPPRAKPRPTLREIRWSGRSEGDPSDRSIRLIRPSNETGGTPPPPDPTAPGPILVVDDDAGLREAISALLEDEGYPVVTAANGHAALQVIQARRPSLVLLDMRMPGLNGWDLARELEQRGIALPIIVMTAARDAAAWAAEIQAAAYLAKPFDLPELLDLVERLGGRPPT